MRDLNSQSRATSAARRPRAAGAGALLLTWAVFAGPAVCLGQVDPNAAQLDSNAAGATPAVTAFDRYVVAGGWITLLLLIPMSVAAMAVMIVGLLSTRSALLTAPDLYSRLLANLDRGDFDAAVRDCAQADSVLGRVVFAGFQRASDGPMEVRRSMQMETDDQAATILRRLDYLNLIGHVAPMVGLFGTVHGIIGMFGSISESGGVPMMARISGDLGTALVATFWGLLIAIPSLAAFNLLRGRLDRGMRECVARSESVLFAVMGRVTVKLPVSAVA